MKGKETGRKKEHIIFLLGGWDIGGVERITRVLADAFVKIGFRVTIAAFKFDRRDLLADIDERIGICELSYPCGTEKTSKNCAHGVVLMKKYFSSTIGRCHSELPGSFARRSKGLMPN